MTNYPSITRVCIDVAYFFSISVTLILLVGKPAFAQAYCEPTFQGQFQNQQNLNDQLAQARKLTAELNAVKLGEGKENQTAVDTSKEIVAGKRVGSFLLDADLSAIQQSLPLSDAKEDRSPFDAKTSYLVYESFAQGLRFFVDPQTKKLKLIEVQSTLYKTADGITASSPKEKALASYPGDTSESRHTSKGIAFVLKGEVVDSVMVFLND